MARVFLLLCFAVTASCTIAEAPPEPSPAVGGYDMHIVDTQMWSRGTEVPITLVVPRTGAPLPLVVMAHGHGGSRDEGGGYRSIALALADRGIASIRMDFPGCGDSVESFTENNLSNMLQDMASARAYAEEFAEIDPRRLGLLGYSMGGRVVALLSDVDPSYRAMAMWTPAVSAGAERVQSALGGPNAYRELREQARTTGEAVYTTRWGTELALGPQWFTDIENSTPLDAVARFEGPLLVLYGDRDDVVLPEVSEAAIRAAASSNDVMRYVVAGADHALGFYDNRPHIATQVVETTADFFATRL